MTPQEVAAIQRDEDLRAVLATPAGKRFVWRLVDEVGKLHAASFSGEETHRTAYLEGRRSVALDVLREAMRVAPISYVEAMRDALEGRRLREEAERAKR